ncbi:MAG: DNA topoisomerase IB [Actinobacteria bacterium]|nr:DNA topoisomerase IB [Actinomycetota bacterium]
MARLRRVDCSGPGIRRRRRGRGFEFVDEDGNRVDEPEVLARIGELVIPPAWDEVWVCPYPLGHIQATGIDARGRKQYIYHPHWRARRDQQKFDSMIDFARALPLMRRRIRRDLADTEMSRQRVLACAVRLLDRGFFRVGGEDYAVENETYGLATMLKSHVTVGGAELTFDYPAKSGQRRVQSVVDPEVAEIVRALKRRRGGSPELLAYREGRRWVDVKSAEINEYVKRVTGGDFSAKDFRTWNATVLAAVALAVSGPAATASKTARKRAKVRAVKEVAHYLGNTPAVARASYIDPRVFDRFDSGLTIGGVLPEVADSSDMDSLHGPIEEAVLDLIAADESSPAVEKVA